MKTLQLEAIGKEGRFSNWLLHYLLGRTLAEQFEATLKTPTWIGEDLFRIADPKIVRPAPALAAEAVGQDWTGVRSLPPFFNVPHRVLDPCITRPNAQRVFAWRPRYAPAAEPVEVAVHVRRGDFVSLKGFPVVPKPALRRCVAKAGFDPRRIVWVEEDKPHAAKVGHPRLLADFHLLLSARHVFVYPRSTFSQMAALLGQGQIYMPFNYDQNAEQIEYRLADSNLPVVFPTRNNTLL